MCAIHVTQYPALKHFLLSEMLAAKGPINLKLLHIIYKAIQRTSD